MMREGAFTLISVVLLAGNLAAIGTSGRERAKRAVCLANLNQLASAWSMYADQNDGKIVNGVSGLHYLKSGSYTSDGSYRNVVERAWVGRGWGANWNNPNVANTGMTEAQKQKAIQEGALWPLIGDARLYKCPAGRQYEWVTYSIVDAMNGLNASNGRTGVSTGANHVTAVGTRIGDTVLWIKRQTEIISPPPADRMVFIDEGAVTPDSFGVHYQPGPWWDGPPVRHNDGTTVSWADGHASYLQWKGVDTIEFGRRYRDCYGGGGFTPQTQEGKKDLDDFRRAVWGRLGY
jgi:prepilin-type processing-associated H-X9-DG protein